MFRLWVVRCSYNSSAESAAPTIRCHMRGLWVFQSADKTWQEYDDDAQMHLDAGYEAFLVDKNKPLVVLNVTHHRAT